MLALWCYGFHKVWTTESLAARSAKVKRAVGFLGYDPRMADDLFRDPKPTPNQREPLPPDSPGNRWARDWRGRPVNLWGLRKGENGR